MQSNLLQARHMIELGDLQKSVLIYQDILEHEPDNINVLLEMSEILSQLKCHDDALEKIRRAIGLAPNSAIAQSVLGKVLMNSGQVEDGEASFRKAIALDPSFVTAYIGLGVLLSRKHQIEQSTSFLLRAVDIEPNNWTAHFNLFINYFESN